MALPGCRQSVFRAELLAVARASEECQPTRVVSDVKLKDEADPGSCIGRPRAKTMKHPRDKLSKNNHLALDFNGIVRHNSVHKCGHDLKGHACRNLATLKAGDGNAKHGPHFHDPPDPIEPPHKKN
eukprot:76811-Amphidinium_carterae.1